MLVVDAVVDPRHLPPAGSLLELSDFLPGFPVPGAAGCEQGRSPRGGHEPWQLGDQSPRRTGAVGSHSGIAATTNRLMPGSRRATRRPLTIRVNTRWAPGRSVPWSPPKTPVRRPPSPARPSPLDPSGKGGQLGYFSIGQTCGNPLAGIGSDLALTGHVNIEKFD